MLHSFYFSASNTTEKTVKAIAANLGFDTTHHNLTAQGMPSIAEFSNEDLILFAAPVYAGRIPAVAAEKFKKIKGNGQKCVAIVVYGNRDYDDALVELCDIMKDNGFDVVAAAAFVAEHCIFPKVATNRPDDSDMLKISDFSKGVKESLEHGLSLDTDIVKGSRPYKIPAPIPIHPKIDKEKCVDCGKCANECPVQAIPVENPKETDKEKCISCSRCINICPEGARYFGGLKYKAVAPLFIKKCSTRREPEWFLAKQVLSE